MEEKQYRPNVAAVVLSSCYPLKTRIFIARRKDIPNAWQFPQGGIDEGEDPKTALFRELQEEIGTNKIEIIDRYPNWLSYDFPKQVSHKMSAFKGQKQRYFLVRLKDDSLVNVNTQIPEFLEYRFVKLSEVLETVSYFKKPIYEKVLNYFKENGYL